jgi:hypothetical protein
LIIGRDRHHEFHGVRDILLADYGDEKQQHLSIIGDTTRSSKGRVD